jgi:hypothetical protein
MLLYAKIRLACVSSLSYDFDGDISSFWRISNRMFHQIIQTKTQIARHPEAEGSSKDPVFMPKSRGWELNPHIAALQAAA